MQQLDSHFVACLLYLTVRRCLENVVFMRVFFKSVIDFATIKKQPILLDGLLFYDCIFFMQVIVLS